MASLGLGIAIIRGVFFFGGGNRKAITMMLHNKLTEIHLVIYFLPKMRD